MTLPLRLCRRDASMSARMAVLFLAVLGAACSPPNADEEPKAAPSGPVTDVTLNAEQVAHGGVRWSAAAASPAADFVEVPGRLVLDEDHTARLSVSVRGRVTAVRANLGDAVSRGQVLVVLQSE
jgi:multidrug efflux pump subunit AcrA (membrane-fusion protein)